MNIPPGSAFDLIRRRVAFGIELIDPLTREIVSRNMRVTLVDDPALPIISASGRFAWWVQQGDQPQAVDILSSDSRYRSQRYALDFQQAPQPAPLFRLLLETTQAYPFVAEMTLVRGQLLETRPVGNAPLRPIRNAQLLLRWNDVDRGVIDGPPCASSTSGEFAAALPLPAGAKPSTTRTEPPALILSLRVQRRDLPGPPQTRTAPLSGIRQSMQHVLPAPIIWDELS